MVQRDLEAVSGRVGTKFEGFTINRIEKRAMFASLWSDSLIERIDLIVIREVVAEKTLSQPILTNN